MEAFTLHLGSMGKGQSKAGEEMDLFGGCEVDGWKQQGRIRCGNGGCKREQNQELFKKDNTQL